MKKALIYLRVSDIMQEEKDSLSNQEKQAIEYCDFKKYKVYKIIKEVASGRSSDRDGFVELQNEISENNFDVLIFYELSRLARSCVTIHNLVHSMRVKEISFESITESYLNSDAPTSKIMLGMIASLAETESDIISKRVKTRMKFLTSQGYYPFKAPFGYRNINNILEIVEEEAEVIKEFFQDFIDGYSIAQLRRKYNVSHPGVWRRLTNVAYNGKTKFGFEGKNNNTGKWERNKEGEVFEGKHEAIISDDVFNLAQRRLETFKHSRRSKGTSLLSGLINHCDKWKMYIKVQARKTEPFYYKYYSCPVCGKSIGADKIESIILEEVKDYILNLKFLDTRIENKKNSKSIKEIIKKLEDKKKRIIDSYIDGLIDRDTQKERVGEINKELEALVSKEEIEVTTQINKTFKEEVIAIIEDIENLDIKKQQAVLGLVIEKIDISDAEDIKIYYKI